MPPATAFFNHSMPGRIGRWWFQRRSYSLTPLILLILLLPKEFVPSDGVFYGAIALAALGEIIRIWAVGYAGSATRTRGDTVPQLVCAGPYRLVRNPLYIGNTLLYTSAAVIFGFQWLAVAVFAFAAIQYSFIVAFEEEVLTQSFGDAYRTYCAATSRWLPLRAPAPDSGHVFSLGRALKSEKSTFYSILGVTALYFVKRQFFA